MSPALAKTPHVAARVRAAGTESDADDAVFKALASAARRRLLDELRDGPRTSGQLCAALCALDRCTVMQHLTVLEQAGLVLVQRRGRERWNHLAPLPIKRIYDRWISWYAGPALELLDRLDRNLGTAPTD
jgi:DNA-binding transcriptional ArsR family regulator